ncbi:type II toxin-antitoxin system VapB family antitoxin [Faucicola mancuniensis]|uniref:type II toxin-antitoxin system VapB family antitoxin n=1 Tax=Faucicola mancuniensis TaxID=1309795 RepID=UPI0028E453EB|nr:type II toxin-antitoxin system VapB family antitoxin [uncultured Moraxella sp.]
MQATIQIDDNLLQKAQQYTNIKEQSTLIREALTALIQRESAKTLAKMVGTEPNLTQIPRRHYDDFS